MKTGYDHVDYAKLEEENEQLRKDLMSMQTGMAQAQRSLEEAIRNLTRYIEYKAPKQDDISV
jgi:cell division protein ZapA (FtsZ GTPase activity inhibitor)